MGFLLRTLREPSLSFTLRHAFIMTFARTGDRRLRRAEPLPPYDEYDYTVQEFGNSCPQQAFSLPISFPGSDKVVKHFDRLYGDFMRDAEDCKAHPMSLDPCITQNYIQGLTVNVVKPAGATYKSNLPVLVVSGFMLPSFFGIQATNFFSGSLAVDLKSAVPLRVYPPPLVRSLFDNCFWPVSTAERWWSVHFSSMSRSSTSASIIGESFFNHFEKRASLTPTFLVFLVCSSMSRK